MVRTKAENSARKAVAAKAPRKALGGGSGGSGGSSGMQSPSGSGKVSKYAGGNSACERPTPDWQKSIMGFCVKQQTSIEADSLTTMSEGDLIAGPSAAAASSGSSGSSQSTSGSQENLSQSSDNSSSNVKRNGLIDSDDDD